MLYFQMSEKGIIPAERSTGLWDSLWSGFKFTPAKMLDLKKRLQICHLYRVKIDGRELWTCSIPGLSC